MKVFASLACDAMFRRVAFAAAAILIAMSLCETGARAGTTTTITGVML